MSTLLPTSSTYITERKIREVIDGEGVMLDFDQVAVCDEEKDCFPKEEVINNMSYACEGEDSDDDDDSMPFEKFARQMEDMTGDGGVKKEIRKAGAGKVVPEDSIVIVHYNAYLEMAAESYDSSRLRNKPYKFRLGSSEVLTGFDYAVSSMRKGELSRYLITPEYALGEAGCPPRIPPNATVMMEIELLDFVEEGGVEDFFHLSNEERGKLPFDQIKKVCLSKKEEGDVFVKDDQWGKALSVYKKAMNILELVNLKNSTEQREQQRMLLKLYNNMALCSLKLSSYPFVIMLCRKVLEIESCNVKAMFRKAQAFRYLSDFERAKEWLVKARKYEPNSVDITKELETLANDVKNFNMLEKDMCKKMFAKPDADDKQELDKSSDKDTTETPSTSATPTTDLRTNYIAQMSPEFIAMVENKLKEFQDASGETELPFPACNLTVPELGYVMQAAYDLNLDVFQKGEGYNLKLKIRKKPT